ncbi:MAG: hypothetical protein Q4F21_01545 [Lachnospiraceae bacterium]|nr:hypothetical protein [Lachnospiraceae bacterium]
MIKTEWNHMLMDVEKTLQLGRAYMEDAERSEEQSDYIAAKSIYHMCCDMFSGVLKQHSSCEIEAKGEYMHTLFRCAMLPQTKQKEKMQYLNQAYQLASELEKETGDMEYTIAIGCIQEEIEELNKVMQQQMRQRQSEILPF